MKKWMAVIWLLLLQLALSGCAAPKNVERKPVAHELPPDEPVYARIVIAADDREVDAVLFDNQTARAFAAMLPLTADTWNPAPGFARAFDLPEWIEDTQEHTRLYEKGGLAYWYDGASIAMFYGDHLPQTIVPVVTVGRMLSDVDFLENYDGRLTIQRKEEMKP